MRDPCHPKQGLSRRDLLCAGAGGGCVLALGGLLGSSSRSAGAQTAKKGWVRTRRSPWFSRLEEGHVRCELCPRHCRVAPGRRGVCRVRENRNGALYSLVYGNPSMVQVDPVERKPFFHVHPGSRTLSVSTAGCNMSCKFCEVWDMALVGPEDVHAHDLPPEAVVAHARASGARSISYTFGEPVVFYEYMDAVASLARKAGLMNLVQTNGYIAPEPLGALCGKLDAANIDLKGFDPAFYREVCGGELEPVMETLKRLKAEGVHVEITRIVIPTLNDDPEEIRRMARWIARELGPGVPVHFSRFYPLYKLANLPATPVRTLNSARTIAREEGLQYVYITRATGHEGQNTFCPGCGKTIIQRTGFVVEQNLVKAGRCGHCGNAVPGRWD